MTSADAELTVEWFRSILSLAGDSVGVLLKYAAKALTCLACLHAQPWRGSSERSL